jgi:iron complex outermembrane receptor protein
VNQRIFSENWRMSRDENALTLYCALIVVGFISTPGRIALAQEHANSDDDSQEVRVRGAAQSAGFVDRAREGETPRETTDAASLVETLPGVHVRRLGADDGFATLSIRGSSSNQVAVLLAGVPLTGGSDPTLDLGSLPVWPGVQIRAYRTFAPASLGPGSLGGTLVLEPPKPSSEAMTETYAGYGTLGSARMRVADARPLGDGQITTALAASRSEDEFEVFTPDTVGGRYVLRRNAGHAQASALVSVVQPVSWSNGHKGAVRMTFIGQARRQELPGTILDPTLYDRLDTVRLIPALELTGDTGGGTWRVRGYARRDEQSLHAPLGGFGAAPHDRDAFIAAGAATGWRGALSERARMDVQLDASSERYAPGLYFGSGSTPEGARRLAAGVGADVDVRAARALGLSATGRLDGWRDESTGSSGHETSDLRPTGHAGFEAYAGAFTFAAHGGATARPPAFLERYGNRGVFLPNPDLRTESAATVDAGIRFASRFGALRLAWSGAAFATFADDLITFVPTSAFGRLKAENIGRARILGLEGELDARIASFDLRVVYTGLDPRNLSECHFVDGGCERPRLPGRPSHDLVADASYRFGLLRIRYGVDAVSGIPADLTGSVPDVPTRVLQSVGAYLQLTKRPELFLSGEVKNLFDVRAVEYAGVQGPILLPVGDVWNFPIPGRTAFVSLRFRERVP